MKRWAMCVSVCLLVVSVLLLGSCGGSGVAAVTITFPAGNALAIDQGQSIMITVMTANDAGKGVTWTCTGTACPAGGLTNVTITSVTFSGAGATGTATVTATSVDQPTISKSVTITVNAVPGISTTQAQLTAAPATAGQGYTFSFTATGGSGTLTWSATGLSDGLSINTSTGAITGTPTAKGTVTFTVTVKDSSAAGAQSFTTGTLTITVNNPPPPAVTTTQAQLTAAPGTAGTAYPAFTFHATGTGALTWSATGLPADGLLLSAAGILSGTPTSKATITFMVTVSDAFGQSSAATAFTITVNNPPAPAITTTQAQVTAKPAVVGSLYSFGFTGTGSGTLTWSATGLPADGLSLNTSTGVVSGTPTTQTTVTIMLTLSDTFGQSSAATSFTITVDSAPAITSGNNTTFTVGAAGTFGVTATGVPTPTLSETGALPSGVLFTDNGNGTATLSGTPAAATGGVYTITIKATNAVATTPQTFTLTVNQAPVFSSLNNATFTVGAMGMFTVTAAGPPKPSFGETGALPSGVLFTDNGNGTATLSGTPATGTGGTYTLTINATNIVGTTPQSFTLTVNTAPVFTSASSTTFTVGALGTFTVAASGTPAPTLSQTTGALPSGVTFTASTGVLSGTPVAGTGGMYTLTFKATNTSGSNTQTFTLTVDQAPAITSVSNATFTVGVFGSFTVTTSGFPKPALSDNAAALPSGVTFVDNGDGTGTLSGTPASGTANTYPITFTANNGVGTQASQSFTLTVNLAPVFTSATSTTFTVGTAGSFTVMVSGTPTPTISQTGGTLPSGVMFTASTGVLSGTPAAGTGGTYTLMFKATSSSGSTTQTFTLTVNQLPFFTTNTSTTFTVGNFGSFMVMAVGPPPLTSLSDNSATLPSGVTYVDNGNGMGTLSGTPATGTTGTYTITFTAANALGSTNQSFTLTVSATAANCTGAPTGHEASLKGQFTFLFQGWNGNNGGTPYPQAYVASFAVDGLGNITNLGGGVGGEVDTNDTNQGHQNFTLNSTSSDATTLYKVGADPTGSGDLGCVVLSSSTQGGGGAAFRFSLGKKNGSGIYTKGRIIEYDDATGNQSRGSGVMLLQTTPFTNPNQSLAFGASGYDSALGPVSSGGFVTVNGGAGTLSNLTVDFDDAGTVDGGFTGPLLGFASNNGFVSAPDTNGGRSTITVNVQVGPNPVTSNFARYQVDANEYFYISTDPVSTSPLLSGRMIATHPHGGFSNSSLSGNYVIHLNGNGGGVANVTLGIVTLTGGTVNGTIFNYAQGNGAASSQSVSGNYTVNTNTGRTPLSGAGIGNHPPILYVTAPVASTEPVSAFLVGTDGSGTFGLAEASSGTFTTAGLAANYFFGTENPGDNSVGNNVGVVNIAASGAVTGTQDKSGNSGLSTGSVTGSSLSITNSNGECNLGANTVGITKGESIFFFDEGSPAGSSSAKINVIEKQ